MHEATEVAAAALSAITVDTVGVAHDARGDER